MPIHNTGIKSMKYEADYIKGEVGDFDYLQKTGKGKLKEPQIPKQAVFTDESSYKPLMITPKMKPKCNVLRVPKEVMAAVRNDPTLTKYQKHVKKAKLIAAAKAEEKKLFPNCERLFTRFDPNKKSIVQVGPGPTAMKVLTTNMKSPLYSKFVEFKVTTRMIQMTNSLIGCQIPSSVPKVNIVMKPASANAVAEKIAAMYVTKKHKKRS